MVYIENAPIRREFTSKIGEPIITQMENFAPGKNLDFTALRHLKEPEDIRKYFQERVEMERRNNPNDKEPEISVRAQLDYIANYSDNLNDGWKLFRNVLGDK